MWIYFYNKRSSGSTVAVVKTVALNVKLQYFSLLILGITSPVCSEGNIVTSKIGAGVILKALLNIRIDVDTLPDGDEKGTSIETIVPVKELVKEADQIMKY